MGGHNIAGLEPDVGEKAFVPFEQTAALQGVGKLHGWTLRGPTVRRNTVPA